MNFISIIMGSKSDLEIMKECANVLKNFKIKYELIISSAHRSPARTEAYVKDAELRGAAIFIAGAGMAAHLAGAIAAHTTCPVIGVPLNSSPLMGLDALLSTVQMPSSVPVATMAIGKAGAINAAYLAIQMMAINNSALTERLKDDRLKKIQKIEEDSKDIEINGIR